MDVPLSDTKKKQDKDERERETRREINRDGDRHVGHDEEEFSLNFSLVKPNAVQICTFSDGTEKAASLSLPLRLVCFPSRYWAICRAYVYYAHCQIITRDSGIIVPVESKSLGDWRERKHTRTRIELLFLVIANFLSHLSRSGDYITAR